MSRYAAPITFLLVAILLVVAGDRIKLPDFGQVLPIPSKQLDEGAWIIVIEETSERTPEVAKVFAAADFWDGLKARGLNWRAYDDDSPDAAKFIEKVKSLPGVLVIAKDGKIVRTGPLLTPVDKLDAFVKEATGR